MNVTVKSATPTALVNMDLLWSDDCGDCVCNLPHTHQAHFAAIEREQTEMQDERAVLKHTRPIDCNEEEPPDWENALPQEAPTLEGPDITTDDVTLMRTLALVQSLVCGITQRLTDRFWELYPNVGEPVICFDLPTVRA